MSYDAVNFILHTLILFVAFTLLTYFFRRFINIEGFWGYVILSCLFLPANVLGGPLGQTDYALQSVPVVMFAMALATNFILLYAWSWKLPGLVISGWPSLLLFTAIFTVISTLVFAIEPIDFSALLALG